MSVLMWVTILGFATNLILFGLVYTFNPKLEETTDWIGKIMLAVMILIPWVLTLFSLGSIWYVYRTKNQKDTEDDG